MSILGFHHLCTFLLLASSILLLIPCITAPTVNDLSMLTVRGPSTQLGRSGRVELGIWGGCVVRDGAPDFCTRARVRYRPSRFVSTALGNGIVLRRTGDGITGGLLLAPVLCGTAFVAFLIACCSYAIGFCFAAFVAAVVFLGTLVLVIVQSTVFALLHSHSNAVPGVSATYGAAFWCSIAALPVLFIAMCASFAACFSDKRERRGVF